MVPDALVRDFGPVWGASGVQGFFGEGYWFHRLPWPLGWPWLSGLTFVAKTTTLEERDGNTALCADGITPRDWFPNSVVAYPLLASMVNNWSLSGKGAPWLLDRNRWQQRTEPFMLSFMSLGKTKEERLRELAAFVGLLAAELPKFQAKIALQINFSCPNVGHPPAELIGEVAESLDLALSLGIPLIPKINALVPAEAVAEFARHPACSAVCTSNTIPWGQRSDVIPWDRFGEKSPLEDRKLKYPGKGGLSGKYLLPLVVEQVRAIRKACPDLHINAGGGIMRPTDVERLQRVGANSISLGTVVTLRPRRTRKIIVRAHELMGWGD